MESNLGRHSDPAPERPIDMLRRELKILKNSCIWTCRELTLFGIAKRNKLELKDLHIEVRALRSSVQIYLEWLGQHRQLIRIEEFKMLRERKIAMEDIEYLWQKFLRFLLLQYFYLKLENILALWEKVLYLLLLYFSISEFPNRLRPPCTTMPWTIWPALVVLWGVCWMFYEDYDWNWEDEVGLSTASSTTGLFEDIGHTDPSQVLNFNLGDVSFNTSMWNAPHFDVPNLEQQLRLHAPGLSSTFDTAISPDFIPTSLTANPTDTVIRPFTIQGNTNGIVATPSFDSCSATSTMPRDTGNRQLEATESRALASITSVAHTQPRDGQIGPSRNSKHCQTEKYFCNYADCIHSQLGSGFKRKDHLDQHLRGPHKQTSVQKLRAKPVPASRIGNPMTTGGTAEALLQSKKRKQRSEEETSGSNLDSLEKELAEERGLRRLAEEDNHLLRQKLDNYERRMEKYEERLDRMMNLLEEHKREETR